jgi:hypothetical protein
VCNWWAQVESSEFAEKELVRKNFIESFLPLFKGKLDEPIAFEEFNFSKIKEHLDKAREARNARSNEEKKKEQLER